MSLPVHLVASLDGFAVGSGVEVTGDEAHHAVAVRRLRVGEEVVLTDGAGRRVVGSVASTGKRVFTVTVTSAESVERPTPSFTVVQALPKGDRGELAVELATEAGVDAVLPWRAARCVARWDAGPRGEKALARWRTTAREAAKQARRAWVPVIEEPMTAAALARRVAQARVALVLHESAADGLASLDLPADGDLLLVVGPEGGIADDAVSYTHLTLPTILLV